MWIIDFGVEVLKFVFLVSFLVDLYVYCSLRILVFYNEWDVKLEDFGFGWVLEVFMEFELIYFRFYF